MVFCECAASKNYELCTIFSALDQNLRAFYASAEGAIEILEYFAAEQPFMHLGEKKPAQIVDLFARLGGGCTLSTPLATGLDTHISFWQ